jgi:hypothetical protein
MPVCSRCGEENPERAKFCLACAAPLVLALIGTIGVGYLLLARRRI